MGDVTTLPRQVPAMASSNCGGSLVTILEDRTEYTLDGNLRTTWKPPSVVSTDLRSEAIRLADMIDGGMRPATLDKMTQWLMDLAPLVAAKLTADEAATKLKAYVGMLEYPAACFTRASLMKAGKRFTWFPAFAEVCKFLDEQLAEIKTKRSRLDAIIAAADGVKQLAKPEPVSIEERQHVGSLFGMLAKAMASGNYAGVIAAANARRQKPMA